MTDDEEVIVKVEPDLSAGEDGKTAERQRDDKGRFVSDPAIEDLATQYRELQAKDAEREAARQAAESRAREATAEADRARKAEAAARSEVVDSQADTIESGLAAAQSEASAAEGEYASAMEAGDFARAAKAQRRIANAEAKIVRLDEAKSDIAARKTDPQREPTRTQQQTTDPVETYIAGRSEPTANWLRQHRDWVIDPKKNAKLTAAHWNAVGEGLTPDTTDYFDHVESFIGLRDTKDANGAGNGAVRSTQTQTRQTRRTTVPAAPVHASGGGTSGGGAEVRLSQREALAAQDGTHVWNYGDPSPQKRFKKGDAIGIQEFARRKLEMQKQGLYDKSYTEA